MSTRTIGGSDVAAILGFSPWTTPFEAWHSIMYGRTSTASEVTDRGNWLEPVLLERYGREVSPIVQTQVEATGREPWMSGHLDAVAQNRRIVEAKTDAMGRWAPTGTVIERWPETEETPVPAYYASQGYWYMEITGMEAVDFAVLQGRLEYRVVTLLRDERVQARIVSLVAEWRERHIVTETPPPVDWSAAARSYASRTLPTGKALSEPTPEQVQMVLRHAEISRHLKELEQEKDTLSNRLLLELGESYGYKLPGKGKLIAPAIKGRRTYDLDKLEADHPGLLASYARTGEPTRQVRTYGLGDDHE